MNAVKTFFNYLLKHPLAVKKFLVALGALVVTAATLSTDGFTMPEVVTIIVEFFAAIGVYGAANRGQSAPRVEPLRHTPMEDRTDV